MTNSVIVKTNNVLTTWIKIVFNEIKKFDLYTIFANSRGILLSKHRFVIKKERNIKYNLKIILILNCTCFSNFYIGNNKTALFYRMSLIVCLRQKRFLTLHHVFPIRSAYQVKSIYSQTILKFTIQYLIGEVSKESNILSLKNKKSLCVCDFDSDQKL